MPRTPSGRSGRCNPNDLSEVASVDAVVVVSTALRPESRPPGEGRGQRAQANSVSVCDHDGKATGVLRLRPLRAEVVCDQCEATVQINPASAVVRFCDAVEMDQIFRRAKAKADAEPSVEGSGRLLNP